MVLRPYDNWVRGRRDTTKTAESAAIPMTPRLARALAKLKDRGYFTSDKDYIFVRELEPDHPAPEHQLREAFKLARAAAGLKPIRMYNLRHSFGTGLAAKGVDMRTIQALTRHTHLTTTEQYLAYSPRPELASQIARALDSSSAVEELPRGNAHHEPRAVTIVRLSARDRAAARVAHTMRTGRAYGTGGMLTVSDMRGRARAFVNEWAGETREAAERQTFWNEWFEIFGIRRRRRVTFERNVKKLSGTTGQIDAFWPGRVLVEHKSAGEDLDAAMDQAEGYLHGLKEEELPQLIILSDFDRFRVLDLDTRSETEFAIHELPDKLEMFTFLAGYRSRTFGEEHEVNVKAAELMGVLHDKLAASGYRDHRLRVMLVRLLFLMFADDTALWGETGLFEEYLERKTDEDGSDLGMHLGALFEVLDQPREERQAALDQTLDAFPYVNGQLFSERIPLAAFDQSMRETLLLACRFNWSKISPAIFGSMFQSVMKPAERRMIGAHYTTERNILKTIGPLFLDELRTRLDAAGNDRQKLRQLFGELRRLTFFDPACGCGNFLVIAYRELRRVELEVLRRLQKLDKKVREGQLSADVALLSHVDVDQFYGIEIEEFPARIAEVAMYLMDHLANQELSQEFGLTYARIPLHTPANIHVENALRTDWNTVIDASRCSYVFGNPPFVAKKRRDDEQVADMKRIFGGTSVLDYVTAWFAKATDYIKGTGARVAFVATNSIVQGEQVPALWPILLGKGMRVDFAHRSFRWTSEARGKAAVYVVIIGFSEGGKRRQKLIFDYEKASVDDPQERLATEVNPYLADAPANVLPRPSRTTLLLVPAMSFGSMPNDGGHLLLTATERETIESVDPIAAKYIKVLLGADGMLDGGERWCLWLKGANPADLRNSGELRSRIQRVREYRLASKRAATRELASTPSLFAEIRQPTRDYICVPRHTSENRAYVPMVQSSVDVIAHDSTMTIETSDLYVFGLLHSAMWMAWVRAIGGRLKGDYRISATLVYNTFPWPDPPSEPQRERVIDAANEMLVARANHPGSTLADLYDPLAMPSDLVRAHRQLNQVTDSLYGRGRFDEVSRLATLLRRYQTLARLTPAKHRER